LTARTLDPVSRARLTFPLSDIVHHVKPSVSVFQGNRSADPEYITDGACLLRADAIRTPGRARRLLARVNELDRRATTEQLQQVLAGATGPRLAPLDFLGLDPTPADADKPRNFRYIRLRIEYQMGPTAVFTHDNGYTETHYRAQYVSLLLDYIGPDAVQWWAPADTTTGPAVVYPVGVNIICRRRPEPLALLMPYRVPKR